MQFLSLYVKGFNPAATQLDDIKTFYSNFGEVINLKYTMSGACLVSFSDRESARNAKETTNGTFINGRTLEVTYFEPREIREL
jgi:RNA recognition motif-containing protein